MRNRAFTLGVINGALVMVVASMVRPDLVLSAFVLRLTSSTFLAALPTALMHLGGLWPQLIVAHIAEGLPRKKPIYIISNASRILSLMAMALTAYLLGEESPVLLATLCLFCFFVYSSGCGGSGIAFMDIVARTIPATRRGSFMGLRGFYGGALGLGAGFFVRYMLGSEGLAFPLNYAALFTTAAIFLACATSLFAAVNEPPAVQKKERGSFREHLQRGVASLREDDNYRLLVVVRSLMGTIAVGQVVFIPYAIVGLSLPDSIVGVLMILAACLSLPANFLWSHIGDRHGNRLLILIAGAVYLAAPVLALTSSYLPTWSTGGWLPAEYDLRALTFVLAFVLGAAGMRGAMMGSTNYLLEIAPDERRPSYMAFMRVLQAPSALLAPLLGGIVADLISFQAAFALACLAGAVTLALTVKLKEPRQTNAAK
ncbi:MAG: MFS transporter [Gemmatimonadetes bacterium]|jgi:MFS family permease|nr:MFS transporter [Gemmatimonadota bacterium]